MPEATYEIGIRVAWWFKFYLAGVQIVAFLTMREPDEEKIKAMFDRAATPYAIEKSRSRHA